MFPYLPVFLIKASYLRIDILYLAFNSESSRNLSVPVRRWIGFYRAMLCIRGTSHGQCVRPCLSQAGVLYTKTAERRITKTTPHDTPGTLVSWCQRSPRNSTGITPYGGANAGGMGQNRRISNRLHVYLENGKR